MMKTSPTKFFKAAATAASLTLAAAATATWTVPASATAMTMTSTSIVGQGAYLCQSAPRGLPMETYDITLRYSLTAPAAVAPGQTISLSGTATLQFPEKAYQEGKTYGETEADGYSDTMSVATTSNGRTSDVGANRWQTAPFPWSDPVVISAPITFHPFTVPVNATGSLTLTLPRDQRAAPNTASNSPATVAFNAVANNKTAVSNVSENLGCYIQGGAPSVIARIPITRTASAVAPGTSTGTSTGAGTPTGAAAGTTQPGSAAPAGGAGSAAPAAIGVAQGSTPASATTGGGTGATSGQSGPQQFANQGYPYGADATRSGVFVSTDVLILIGGLICIIALGYALLTQYRIRSIKRATDG